MLQLLVSFSFLLLLVLASCEGERHERLLSDGGGAWAAQSPRIEVDGDSSVEPPRCRDDTAPPLAQGLRIREVSLYQTVKVELYTRSSWIDQHETPIVQSKPALLRVFVDTLPNRRPRTVRGVLRVQNETETAFFIDQRTLLASSTERDQVSTFNFRVPGRMLDDATALRIELQEPDCNLPAGAPADASLPADGTTRLVATRNLGGLRVVVVPIAVDGRLPLLTERELVPVREALQAFYPVSAVELSVRRPLEVEGPIPPDDERTWSDLLSVLLRARLADEVADDVYYLGLMQPAATYADYCSQACQLGLAPQVKTPNAAHQVALVASFVDARTSEAVVHELGHAQGLGHAPCALGAPIKGEDPNYPEPTGTTGVWGWDVRTDELRPPTCNDIMGYCTNNWISAYHYGLVADRVEDRNATSGTASAKSVSRYHQLVSSGDGSARWGGVVTLDLGGLETVGAEAYDEQGVFVAKVAAARVALADHQAEFLYLPDFDAAWSRLSVAGRVLNLRAP